MGPSIKSLVANDKSVFKILIFWTYQERVKLTDRELDVASKCTGDEFWNMMQVCKPTSRNQFCFVLRSHKITFYITVIQLLWLCFPPADTLNTPSSSPPPPPLGAIAVHEPWPSVLFASTGLYPELSDSLNTLYLKYQ
jgi:hypothetical protein